MCREETGMSQEAAKRLEQAKLDRDDAFSRYKAALGVKEQINKTLKLREGELNRLRAAIRDLESASWVDSVQAEAAWKERAEVAELALSKKVGEVASMRHVIQQQSGFLRTCCDIQPSKARDQAKILIHMGRCVLVDGAGEPEANAIETSRKLVSAWEGTGILDPAWVRFREAVSALDV